MFRGTTPTLIFNFGINLEEVNITAFYITFSQRNKTLVEKALSDVTISENKVTVKLDQTDTLAMSADTALNIQIRLKIDNEAYATNMITTNLNDILKDGEI